MDSLPTMKLFQMVKVFYNTLGIYSPQTNQILTLNWKKLFFLWQLIQWFIEMTAYLVFKPKNTVEFGYLCFGCVSAIYSLSELLITIWRMPEILKCIELCEKFFEKSK